MALPMKLRTVFTKHRVYFTFSRLSHNQNVRVRFAPSPTGMLHLGGLRTALLNYLFAKSHNGKFVLRIEDTDLTRIVPCAVEKLEQMLQWAGLYPDESPSVGGPYEPYLQSERLTLYNDNMETLLKSGHCYRCFCTERRLSLLRKEAARQGEIPKYDNKCRHLTQSEVEEKLSQNTPYVIRFKYEPLESAWIDLVYGSMHEKSIGQTLEGDFVVIKSDGYPTYHFANVVDDHYMKISHVLRGEEWSISTPKHIQMYQAFGWEPPHYAHLPLILNSDGTKLSKRQGDIRVDIFKDKNYDPNAVLNYLTTVNKGFTEDTAGKTLNEMINIFSLDTLNTHSARLQPEKLKELSATHLQRRFNSDLKPEVIKETGNLLKDHYKERVYNSHVLDNKYIENVLTWALDEKLSNEAVRGVPKGIAYQAGVKQTETFEDSENIPAPSVLEQHSATKSGNHICIDKDNIIVFDLETTGLACHWKRTGLLLGLRYFEDHRICLLDDLLSKTLEFLWVVPEVNHVVSATSKSNKARKIIQETINKLNLVTSFEESTLKEALVCYCKENDLNMKAYMGLLRSVLSEQKEGPSIAEMMEILGNGETIQRLNKALNALNS